MLREEPSIIQRIAFVIKNKDNIGAYGEYLTKYMFRSVKLKGYHKELSNIYIPYKNSTSEKANIIQAGYSEVNNKNWTQMLNKNSKQSFYNPILQNKTHINALSEYLNLDKKIMKSIIVFSEHCELKKVPENTEEYAIINRDKLIVIKKETEQGEIIFTRDEIEEIYNKLFMLTNAYKLTKK